MKHSIYKITSKTSGKSYIGKTVKTISERFERHIKDANKGSEYHFHRAIRKYGVDDFIFTDLENNILPEDINDREKYWIKFHNTYPNQYNMTPGGDGWSEPTKEKLIKGVKTRKMNNSYITGGIKAKKTFEETVIGDLTLREIINRKISETKTSDGWKETIGKSSVTKRKKTMSKLESNGKTKQENATKKALKSKTKKGIHKKAAIKAAETMDKTILENGKTIKEDRINKRNLKMSEIGDDELSGYQRARAKQIKTKSLYNFKIINDHGIVIFEMEGTKEEIENNKYYPIKLFWNLKSKYKISKNTRKENKKFENYTSIKRKIK